VTESADAELVRSHLAGDPGAFPELVRRHERRIYVLCLRVLGNPDDAADATQDALLMLLRKLDRYREEAAFTTWMHRLTLNVCYDQLRKRKRHPLLRAAPVDDGPEPELGPPVPDHADEVVGTESAAAALAAVPEEFRVALVLADVQDMAYDEIAKVLDVPVGTVKSRVHRGRLALARAMGIDAREPKTSAKTSEDQA
jgi:RNA polymerase sigma-70 factor (ECF subfamily)